MYPILQLVLLQGRDTSSQPKTNNPLTMATILIDGRIVHCVRQLEVGPICTFVPPLSIFTKVQFSFPGYFFTFFFHTTVMIFY